MSKFRVGQRVRILDGRHSGKEALIWGIDVFRKGDFLSFSRVGQTCYLLDVDGVGRISQRGLQIAKAGHSLAPLTGPNEEWASDQVRKLFKMPVAA